MTNPPVPTTLCDSNYVIVGLARCFTKEDGNVAPVTVVEPIPSAYFEALIKGVPTSYETLFSLQLGQVVEDNRPTANHLPEAMKGAQFCENFVERVAAAARTYQAKPHVEAQLPLGEAFSNINFSTEKKRILNASYKVTAEDNVKQHKYTHMTL